MSARCVVTRSVCADCDCVIMAGGRGTRLRPLTCDRPKPMVPVLNRPMLDYAFAMLDRAGIGHATLTLHYLPDHVVRYYGRRAVQRRLRLDYSVEEVALGTAGSVKALVGRLKRTTVVLSGDAVSDIDVSGAVSFHRAAGTLVTIVLTRVAVPLEYGVVVTDPSGRIVRFLEKPGWSEVMTDTVNTGIYVIEPQALDAVPDGTEFDFSKDLFPLLLGRGEGLFGWVAEGYWCDVGSLEQYRTTHEDLLAGKVALQPVPDAIGRGCRVDDGAGIHPPVVIGDGCVIEKGAEVGPYAVLGPGCVVRRGASIRRSVAWREVELGAAAEVRGAVLCDRSTIRAGARVLEGAVVGPGSVVGERARVEQWVRLWPGKRIDREVTVTGDVVWSGASSRRLFGSTGVTGSLTDELAPENAVRMGSALGHCVWATRGPSDPEQPKVAVTADDCPCASLVKDAIAAGLASAGVGVVDLGESTTPATCYGVQLTRSNAGVHVRRDPAGDGLIVEFLDRTGLPVDRSYQRRLENAFAAGEFRRAAPDVVSRIVRWGDGDGSGVLPCYERDLLRAADREAIARARLRVVRAVRSGGSDDRSRVAGVVDRILSALGCEVCDASQPAPDIAFSLDANGENLLVTDETGREVGSDTLLGLACLGSGAFASGPVPDLRGRVIPLPTTASLLLEDRLASWGGQVVRVKSSDRGLFFRRALEHRVCVCIEGQDDRGLPRFTFLTVWDGIAHLLVVLEHVARTGMRCSRLSGMFPGAHTLCARVSCPWEAKAPVMRMLAEEGRNWGVGRIDLSEGVRILHDDGWALVVPDADLPQFRVFCEARSPEEASHLLRLYTSRIELLAGGFTRKDR